MKNVIILLTGLFGIGYFFYRRKGIKLSKWLEEYVKDVEKRLSSKEECTNLETSLHILNLIQEITDYLFLENNSYLENKRIQNFGNKNLYEDSIRECEEKKDYFSNIAIKYLEKRLNINIEIYYETINNYHDKKKISEMMNICRKKYYLIPSISKEKTEDAYLTYLNLMNNHNYIVKEQSNLIELNKEYEPIALKVIINNRYCINDFIFKNYGFSKKYFNQLIIKHDLKEEELVKKKEYMKIKSEI